MPTQRPTSSIADALPRVDPSVAADSRLVLDRRLMMALQPAWPGLELQVHAEAPNGPLMRVRIGGAHEGIDVLLCIDSQASVQMLGARADLPDGLRQLAANALLGDALATLAAVGIEGASVADMTCVDRTREPVPADGWYRLASASKEWGVFALQGVCASQRTAWHRLLRRRSAARSLRRSLCLRGAVTLSQRLVARAVLSSLAPGDVLLLTTPDTDLEGTSARVRWGAADRRCWQASARIDDRFLTVQGVLLMQPDTSEADHSADPLAGLDIPVRFEIETVPVSLADLESLRPGSVVELATPLAAASVRLVACGQVIGRADLVAVGDRLGARITMMAGPHAG